MDFNDNSQEAAFRAEVKSWLAKNAPQFSQKGANVRREDENEEDIAAAKEWQALKADAGYAFVQWPQEYGGRGSAMQSVIYAQEEAKYPLPRNYFIIGAFAGPTMMAYATDAQKARFMPPMLRGEEVWCQLFSEPGAGSDLAGIRTRAEKEGDTWVVNGQKVWTSFAYMADWAILVTRHDTTLPKHMGLTYFFLDMKSPGVEVTRIKQISGGSDFCEVFLNDVHIPDSQRLGEIGDGWSVCLTTLMNERFNAGDAYRPDAKELIGLARRLKIDGKPAIENSAIRERIAEWYVQSAGAKFTKFRTLTALSRGQTPGPEASILKLVNASKLQDIGAYGMDVLGMAGILADVDGDEETAQFLMAYLAAPGARIAGGTDEILRNIIAERVLALPGDIRVDKALPFNKLASGAK
jgi:alkylation response protein AidB-like acyl-CoA dehydrogenase